MRVVHWQQKTVIEPLANLPGKLFQYSKIKDQFMVVQCTFDLDQHTIVVPMQAFTFAAVGDEVGWAESKVAAFYLHLTHYLFASHLLAPTGLLSMCNVCES